MAYLRFRKPWNRDATSITDEKAYKGRRKFLQTMGLAGIGGAAWARGLMPATPTPARGPDTRGASFFEAPLDVPEIPCVFAEFSMWNAESARAALALTPDDWHLTIDGLVESPLTLEAGTLGDLMPLEDRPYRFRCIEGWSAVVPWTGFPLSRLIERVRPLNSARYVRFVSFLNSALAPSQSSTAGFHWPYSEALTLPEAMHDLTFVATGMYGHPLPHQHGAPLRLVVPWKYANKSLKSLSRIEFTDVRPRTFWRAARPEAFDFRCNVDPRYPHCHLPQTHEMAIGSGAWQPTLPMNGYADLVAALYG